MAEMLESIIERAVVFLPPIVVLVLFSQVSPLAPIVLDMLGGMPNVVGYMVFALTAVAIVMGWRSGYIKKPQEQTRPVHGFLVCLLLSFSSMLCFRGFPCTVPAFLTLMSAFLLYVLSNRKTSATEETTAVSTWFHEVRNLFLQAGAFSIVVWFVWFLSRLPLPKWTDWTKDFQERVRDGSISWTVAEVEWLVPLFIAMELFIMAALCCFQENAVSNQEKASEQGAAQNGQPERERMLLAGQQGPADGPILTPEKVYLVSQVKLLGLSICILAMVLWLGASIDAAFSPAEPGPEGHEDLRDEVLGLTFWAFAGISAWLLYNLGPENVLLAAKNSKVAMRVVEYMKNDWAKAGYLFFFGPFMPLHFLLKWCLGQSKEKDRSKVDTKDPQAWRVGDALRAGAEMFGEQFFGHLWMASVLTKALWLGLGYVSFEVGMRATLVCLAYTNDLIANMNLYMVLLTIFVVGVGIFLLPPAPGPPVYAVIGIVVIRKTEQEGGSAVYGCILAFTVAFAIKLAFAAIAQKFIGEPLGKRVSVRRLVQVHTTEIRAIEMILKREGFSAAKVSILIGGPDWPVAVLCGILRLSLVQVLLALSPVFLQSVVPCVLSGALLAVNGEDDNTGLSETAVAVAGALQIVALIVAGYYIQETIELHFEELQKERPEDEELIRLDKEEGKKAEAFWANAERQRKENRKVTWILVAGLVCIYFSCLMLAGPWKMILGISSFKKFNLTDSVQTALGGNPFAIVKPLGWLAIMFAVFSGAALSLFYYLVGDGQKDTSADRSLEDRSPEHGSSNLP